MNNEPILFVPCNLENTSMNSVQWFFFYRENVAFSQTTKRLGGKYVVVSGLHPNQPSSISCDLAVKKMGSVRWPVRSIVGLWRVEFIFTLTTAHRYRGLSWSTTTLPITYRSTLRRGCHHMRTIHDPVQYPVICTYKSNNRVVHTQKWINKK